ncbi:MAG: sulfotransferase family protein [Bacteroidales bacterium]
MTGKIIGVGFQKTGTSTLREALIILGYAVKDVTPRALIPILRGNYNKISRMLEQYDAMEDTPWYMIYKELDQLFPGSKFILTIRDEESWYTSVSKHIGDLRAAHHEWIYGRGKGVVKHHKQNAIEVYRRHNAEVLEYFKERPGDLLVLDFTKGDGWEKLCNFLGNEVPGVPLPHYNKTTEAEKRQKGSRHHFRKMRHRIKNELKISYLNVTGLWEKT